MDIVLIIDNYDSFVYNIVQIVGKYGYRPVVVRNDELSVSAIGRMNPDKIIISPGPGTPEKREDIGISGDVIRVYGSKIPVLGVCLGHQIIGYVFGCRVRRAKMILHGKISKVVVINESILFRGLPREFFATRYNSLVVDNLSRELIVDAISYEDKEIMAMHHYKYPIYGVQFHPESIGTEFGEKIIENFLRFA